MVPVRLKRCVAKHTHYRNQEIEHQHHYDTRPDEAQVYLGELKSKQVCANRELEDCNTNEVGDLYDPQIVAVVKHIVGFRDAGICDVTPLAILDDLPTNDCGGYVQ
jgi:hypothetical protein